MADLESRVAQLERSNRRWRVSCLLLLVLGAGLGAQAANVGAFDTVTCKQLRMADASGISVLDDKGTQIGVITSTGRATFRSLSSFTASKREACILGGEDREDKTFSGVFVMKGWEQTMIWFPNSEPMYQPNR